MRPSGIVPSETYERIIQKARDLGVADVPFDVLPQSIATLNKVFREAGIAGVTPNQSTIPLDIYEKCQAVLSAVAPALKQLFGGTAGRLEA